MLQLSNEKTVLHFIDFFKKAGITNNGIAGLLGNVYAESGVRTNNLQNKYNTEFNMTDEEFTQAVDNGTFDFCNPGVKFGYGLCQWTSLGRRTGLYSYCKGSGRSIADESAQFEWLLHELKDSYKTVYNELISNSNTVYSCAEIVVCKFEIPASVINDGPSRQNTINKRAEYAQEFYDTYLKEGNMAKRKIVAINAGHWLGNPKGVPKEMRVMGGTLEFTLNERVVSKVAEMLKDYDVDVLLNYDPTGKTKIELTDRINQANKAPADIYLSIHHNAANTIFDGGGTVVYYYQGDARRQASATRLYDEIRSRTNLKGNRATPICGTKSYQEINNTTAPAFLVECGFMNSTVDIEYIATNAWPVQVATGIVAFLINELGLVKKEDNKPVVNENPAATNDSGVTVTIATKERTEKITLYKGDTITIEG